MGKNQDATLGGKRSKNNIGPHYQKGASPRDLRIITLGSYFDDDGGWVIIEFLVSRLYHSGTSSFFQVPLVTGKHFQATNLTRQPSRHFHSARHLLGLADQ